MIWYPSKSGRYQVSHGMRWKLDSTFIHVAKSVKVFSFFFFPSQSKIQSPWITKLHGYFGFIFFIGRYVWLPFFYASKVFFYLIKSPLKFVPQKIKNKIKKRSSLKSLSCESVHTFYMDISASIFFYKNISDLLFNTKLHGYFGFIFLSGAMCDCPFFTPPKSSFT